MSAEVNLGWNNTRLQAGARGAEAIVRRVSSDMRGSLGKIGQGLGIGAGFSIFETLKNSARESIGFVAQTTVKYDSLRLGMTALEGTISGANSRLAEMQQLAKSPGLGFEQAVDADIKLRSVGLSAALSSRTIEEMGNALAVVGKGKADLDGVLLAITQIVSKGKVSAEELNQIAERVPQIRRVLKDAFGTADSVELQKLNIPVERFIQMTVDGFSRTVPRAIVGLQGKWDNTIDALTARTADFGTALNDNLETPLDEITNVFEKNSETFKAAGATLGVTLRGLGSAVGGFASLIMYSVDGIGQLTEDTLRWTFGLQKNTAEVIRAELAAQRLKDANAELSRNAQDLKRHQDEAADATRNLEDVQRKARESALALAKAQNEVAQKAADARDAARGKFIDARQGTSDKVTTDELKLAQAKERVLQIERDISKVIGQKGGEELTYKLLEEREKVMAQILELSKAISTQSQSEKDQLDQKAKESARIATERANELALLDQELAIINAQNAGHDRKAAALQRAKDIAEETLRIMQATGLAQDEATKKATALVDGRNKGDDRRPDGRKRIKGFDYQKDGGREKEKQRLNERDKATRERLAEIQRRSFGGLREYYDMQKDPNRGKVSTPNLDQYKAMQNDPNRGKVSTPNLDQYKEMQKRGKNAGAPPPAANGQPAAAQELPTVEQLLKTLITTTEGLKEG